MKNLIVLFSACLVCHFSSAQTAGQLSAGGGSGTGFGQSLVNQVAGNMTDQFDRLSKSTGISDFSGSPYTSDNFAIASIYYKDELQDRLYYRYNALNEEIEIKKSPLPEETPQRLLADKAIHLDVSGKKLGFKTFIDRKNNTLNGYLTELINGKEYDLYRRTRVKFTEGQKAQNSFVMAVPNRFTHFIEYYYQKKGVDRIDEVVQSNGALLKILDGDKKVAMKSFLKENNLNIKDEADLIKAFEFLNQ